MILIYTILNNLKTNFRNLLKCCPMWQLAPVLLICNCNFLTQDSHSVSWQWHCSEFLNNVCRYSGTCCGKLSVIMMQRQVGWSKFHTQWSELTEHMLNNIDEMHYRPLSLCLFGENAGSAYIRSVMLNDGHSCALTAHPAARLSHVLSSKWIKALCSLKWVIVWF